MQENGRHRKKVLNVCMLGELHITMDEKEIKLPGNIYNKTTRLFLMIVYYGKQGISRKEVLEQLYGDHEYADDSGSLRVALFRLKKQLVEAGILSEKDSINRKGLFMLDQEGLEVIVDAREFEKIAQKALKTEDETEQLLLLEQACQIYVGDFLPSLSGEIWVAGKQARFQDMYFKCVRTYLKLLSGRGQYGKMLYTVKNVIRLYPYEEWYAAELDALIGMERWKDALERAEQSVQSLMQRMGVRPTEELESRIRKINLHLHGSTKNLLDICRELEEVSSDSGAYYCSYQSFVGTYRYEMRKIERTGESLYLILCSLNGKEEDKSPKGEEQFEYAVKQFGDAIRESLRRADVYTRYGKNQYLMLLEGIKQEDCSVISTRIENRFERAVGAGRYRVRHFITPVMAKEEGTMEDPLSFGSRNWNIIGN